MKFKESGIYRLAFGKFYNKNIELCPHIVFNGDLIKEGDECEYTEIMRVICIKCKGDFMIKIAVN